MKRKKMKEEAQKLSARTILSYMNAPLMDNFVGTKYVIAQFIVSRYHNGKLYFDTPMEITDYLIYKINGLSNKGEPVPTKLNPCLIKEITGTPLGKNSRVLMVNKIIYGTPKITAKIISLA